MFALASSLAALALAQALAHAPSAPGSRRPASDADSSAALERARRLQSNFELRRRSLLPISHGAHYGRCEIRIGRFCYWYDPQEPKPPKEPEKLTTERDRLLDRLAEVSEVIPGDRWLAGQRVRYLVEARRTHEAVAAARACGRETWCLALLGYALHGADSAEGAAAAFDSSLALLPEKERCRWNDVGHLLDEDVASRYRRLPCVDRAAFERRFWALARPLYALPTNDLRTEHLARVTKARIESDARSPHLVRWGDDLREGVIRYGWPTAWSRERPTGLATTASMNVVGHESSPSWAFVPGARAVERPLEAGAGDWDLQDPLARARYAARWAERVGSLEPQVATFRRGDSSVVVAAFDLARDTIFADTAVVAGALAVIDSAGVAAPLVRSSAGTRHAMATTVAAAPAHLVSVEALDSAGRRAARARFSIREPRSDSGATSLSDILLLADSSARPATLAEAVPLARGSTRARSTEPLAVFWEAYGLAPGEVGYTVTVRREGDPWYRRAAQAVRLAAPRAPVHVGFREAVREASAIAGRTLALDLSHLPPGRYRVDVSLELPDGTAATTGRVLVLER